MRLFKSRMFLAFLGLVFTSLFIWFAGPLIGISGTTPLESSYNRIMLICGMSGLFLISFVVRYIRSRKRNAQLLNSIAEEASPADSASQEEQAILQSKMQEAVDTLKTRNFSKKSGSRYLYELPWYVIIGPPGAGKTTLLSNSGLDFPLEDTHGKFSVKGVGGTRNCDWWFTDQAVLLDTAGRYTTQDSEAEVDKSAWGNFLSLLKEKRDRRPINGVLLALSIQDIVQSDDDTLAQTAKTLRTRIDELYAQLGVAPPVYLMFTKCDLLAGFSEFFADLDRQERRQVWGTTLPLDCEDETGLLKSELDALFSHVQKQTPEKMHRELSIANREAIYSFPMQLRFAQKRIDLFTEHLMSQSRLLEKILFRGIYLTSATQTGSVLEKVIQNVSKSFGVNEAAVQSQSTDSGKSFFINELLADVIFGESGLAGTNLKTERRLKLAQTGFAATAAAVLIGLLAIWGTSYAKNRSSISRIDDAAKTFSASVDNLAADSLDLLETSEMLSNVQALGYTLDSEEPDDGFIFKRTGLYQGDKMDRVASTKYQELLIDALLPRLLVRLEHQMHAKNDDSEFLFEALKSYQMIGDREHYEADALTGWFNFDFDRNLPGDTSQANRQALKDHVEQLFKKRPYRLPRPLDQSVITQYQQIAADMPLEQRAYNRIRNSTKTNVNQFYRITAKAGPETALVFTSSDDISLDQSIPLLFTKQGYRDAFIPASDNITAALADDAWVLGPFFNQDAAAVSPAQLKAQVESQYYADYIDTWESFIQKMTLQPVAGLKEASEFVSLITDIDSPLKNMLVIVDDETTLTEPLLPEADAANGAGSENSRETQLAGLLGNEQAESAQAIAKPIDPVTVHFDSLHTLLENWETNGSRLDQVLTQLAEVNLQLLPMAQSTGGPTDPKLATDLAIAIQKLETKSGRLAEPMASLVNGITGDINDVVGGGFCQQLSQAWKTDVFSYYKRAISSRYPVNRNGTTDIAITDFGAFFGPNGVVDTFVNTYLNSVVSKTQGQWTWTGTGSSVCLSDNSLKQLAFADDIKNTFFSQGGALPSFRFDIIPNALTMSADIGQLTLDIGGSQMQYIHGPINGATSFSWPSITNNTQVNLRVEPVIPGSSSSISLSGPWAILRLMDQGSKKRARNGVTVDYSFGGRPVSLSWATSSFNPLNSVAVRNFRAPENL